MQAERNDEGVLVIVSNEATIVPFFLDNIGDKECLRILNNQNSDYSLFIQSNEDDPIIVNIDIDWGEIKDLIAETLNGSETNSAMMVCENNRAAQVGIEILSWVPTIIAGVVTFGAATVGGAALKGAATAGAKAAITKGIKKLATKGVTVAARMAAAKSIARNAFKIFKVAASDLLRKKIVKFGLTVGAGYITKVGFKSGMGALGFGYSLLSSDFSLQVPNCQNLDRNRKILDSSGMYCYKICDENVEKVREDALSKLVLGPLFDGRKYCVNRDDYFVYELNEDLSTGKLLKFPPEKWERIYKNIIKNIQNKNGCNWGMNDIDAFTGFLMYSPDNLLEESSGGMMITNGIRLDE